MLLRWNEGHFAGEHPDFGPLTVDVRSAARRRTIQRHSAHRGQRGERSRPRRGALLAIAPEARIGGRPAAAAVSTCPWDAPGP